MMSGPLERRAVRRELHRGRAPGAVLCALLLFLVAVWLGTETVLLLLGNPPLLLTPGATLAPLAEPRGAVLAPWTVAIALGVGVLGIVCVAQALLPGRRPRRHESLDSGPVIVDDRALAARIARTAHRAAGVAPEQVRVTISRSAVRVGVTPTSGVPVDAEQIRARIEAAPELARLRPPLRVTVSLSSSGRVAA